MDRVVLGMALFNMSSVDVLSKNRRSADSRALKFQLLTADEFEDHEAKAGAESEGGVKEPEVGRGPFLEEGADVTDEAVGGEEGGIVKADEGGIDRFGRVLGEKREADRQQMREGDAVDEMECGRPEERDFVAGGLGGRELLITPDEIQRVHLRQWRRTR